MAEKKKKTTKKQAKKSGQEEKGQNINLNLGSEGDGSSEDIVELHNNAGAVIKLTSKSKDLTKLKDMLNLAEGASQNPYNRPFFENSITKNVSYVG